MYYSSFNFCNLSLLKKAEQKLQKNIFLACFENNSFHLAKESSILSLSNPTFRNPFIQIITLDTHIRIFTIASL